MYLVKSADMFAKKEDSGAGRVLGGTLGGLGGFAAGGIGGMGLGEIAYPLLNKLVKLNPVSGSRQRLMSLGLLLGSLGGGAAGGIGGAKLGEKLSK